MKPISILLIEDNPGDVLLTREAFKKEKVKVNLEVVSNGEEAMDFLYKRSPFENKDTPNLILLDLNLPLKDGRTVLQEINEDKRLKAIPVIVLTTSTSEKDILDSYSLSANSYITKPIDISDFFNIINKINEFWLTIVELPKTNNDLPNEGKNGKA